MPINASGVFSRLFSWTDDRDAGVQILASKMDDEMNGMAAALNSITAGQVPLRGAMRTVNGTPSAPAWSFTSDTATGVYRAANGQLGLAAGGVRAVLLSSTGVRFDLPVDGFTMSGALNMAANQVTVTANPTADNHLARKGYVDAHVGGRLSQAQGDDRYLRRSGSNNMAQDASVVSDGYQGSGGNGYGYSVGASAGGASVRVQNNNAQSATNPSYLVFQGPNITFRVNNNGNVQNANNSYGAISDARWKENIADAGPQLEDLLAMRVVNFNMIGDSHRQIGLIAQEVRAIKPGLVDEDEETGTLSVKYSVLVPMLLKAVQELAAEVRALQEGAA